MSNQQVAAARLRHWNGPFYPSEILPLQALYASLMGAPLWKTIMDSGHALSREDPQFEYRYPCTEKTEDGYQWERGFVFKVLRPGRLVAGHAIIMFPDKGDMRRLDGTHTDRSIALYSNSAVDEVELSALVKRFHLKFCSMIPANAVGY